MKKVVIAILLMVSVILVAGCGGNGKTNKGSFADSPPKMSNTSKTNNDLNSGSLHYSQHTYEGEYIGTKIKFFVYYSSGVALWIRGAEFTKNGIGNVVHHKKAERIFALVNVALKNNDRCTVYVDPSSFKLVDMESGNRYLCSYDGQMAFDESYENLSKFERLERGKEMSKWIVFSVPQDLLNKKIGLLLHRGFDGREVLMDFGELKFKEMK